MTYAQLLQIRRAVAQAIVEADEDNRYYARNSLA